MKFIGRKEQLKNNKKVVSKAFIMNVSRLHRRVMQRAIDVPHLFETICGQYQIE